MKLAITGALGHIGSRLIREIAGIGADEILLIDDLSTQRYCSLFDLPSEGRYHFVEGDICELDVAALMRGFDVVVHLAAFTDAERSVFAADDVFRVNQAGTLRVAQACIESGAGLLFVSTTSVYGSQANVVDESCPEDSLRPQSPYAQSKLLAERSLRELSGNGLRFFIGRFGTVYGISPGMRFHTAVNKFVWLACMGRPLTVWETAMRQMRPYLDIQDAVRAIEFVIRNDRFDNQTYNVVTDNASVAEIIDILRQHFPHLDVQLVQSPIMSQFSYTVSSERFRGLGFDFRGDLTRGIRQTIALLRHAGGRG